MDLRVFLRAAAAVALVLAAASAPPPASAASAGAVDIPNPDAYTAASCGRSGYIDFERYADGSNLSANAINGVGFTTTGGYTWRVGDFATGSYNGKYPSGAYTSQGTHWAWLGETQGTGRIDFTQGRASAISVLISDATPVVLEAYDASGDLLAAAGPAAANINTGHMTELRVTRDTADIDHVLIRDSGNYFLIDALCTDAPGVPQGSLYDWGQRDAAWASQHLYGDNTCGKMGEYGCAITAIADVIASYGRLTLPNGAATNPGNLNTWIASLSAASPPIATHDPRSCGIIWANVVAKLGFGFESLGTTGTLASRHKLVDDTLAAGELAILGIYPSTGLHFVVAYAKTAGGDYMIANPWNKTYGTIASQYPGQSFDSLNPAVKVIHNAAAVPGRPWVVVAHSPVALLLTAPDGSRTGYDSVTGSVILGAAGSEYGVEPGLGDDSGATTPAPDSLWLTQQDLLAGNYRLSVVGTGTGPYTLFFGFTGAPALVVTGRAVPGSVDEFVLAPASGGAVSVTRTVAISMNPGSNPPPINLRKGGVIPVAVLSTPTFDARRIALGSIRFGPNAAKAIDKAASIVDVNGDGIPDIVVHFSAPATGMTSQTTSACLWGTADATAVRGCQVIKLVP